jgi:hypothetical protein
MISAHDMKIARDMKNEKRNENEQVPMTPPRMEKFRVDRRAQGRSVSEGNWVRRVVWLRCRRCYHLC